MSCYQVLNTWQARTTPLNIGYLRNPPQGAWNLSVMKTWALPREGMFMTFRVDCSACSNSPLFTPPVETLSSLPTYVARLGIQGFGAISQTANGQNPRTILFSLKIAF